MTAGQASSSWAFLISKGNIFIKLPAQKEERLSGSLPAWQTVPTTKTQDPGMKITPGLEFQGWQDLFWYEWPWKCEDVFNRTFSKSGVTSTSRYTFQGSKTQTKVSCRHYILYSSQLLQCLQVLSLCYEDFFHQRSNHPGLLAIPFALEGEDRDNQMTFSKR